MLNFYPVNLLHPLKFSIQLLFFNIHISHLLYQSCVHLIELSLESDYFILMLLNIIYAVFKMLSKSFQVNIKISFYWGKHFTHYGCYQSSLYFLQPVFCIHFFLSLNVKQQLLKFLLVCVVICLKLLKLFLNGKQLFID